MLLEPLTIDLKRESTALGTIETCLFYGDGSNVRNQEFAQPVFDVLARLGRPASLVLCRGQRDVVQDIVEELGLTFWRQHFQDESTWLERLLKIPSGWFVAQLAPEPSDALVRFAVDLWRSIRTPWFVFAVPPSEQLELSKPEVERFEQASSAWVEPTGHEGLMLSTRASRTSLRAALAKVLHPAWQQRIVEHD